MTKEEILAMEVGAELDVLVAQEVFGIEVEWDYSPWDINKQLSKKPFYKGEPRTCLGPMAHSVANTIFDYSTDISAAWQVLEKVTEERHCHCEINVYPDGLANVKFTKATGPFTPDEILGWAGIDEDATTSEAICKAALLAIHSQKNI